MGDLSIKYVAINKLIPYANNSRTHDDAQIAQIAASIKEFGFTNPILIDKDDSIIAGHGRVLAARKLNLKAVPTIKLEGLTETQKRAYIIADNKLALNAGWDNDLLMVELDALNNADFDMAILGFYPHELETALELNKKIENLDSQANEINPDSYNMNHTCPRCNFEFNKK